MSNSEPLRYTVGVITASDRCYAGLREDESGALIRQMAEKQGYDVMSYTLLPDDRDLLAAELIRLCDRQCVGLILTTGGTGFSGRDCMPEATLSVADRSAPGIAEALRLHSLALTPRAMFSRAVSAIRGRTLIVNLPGSPRAVCESLEFLLPHLGHGLDILTGRSGECGGHSPDSAIEKGVFG
jgi:molybdopterin adenylyltransferase